MCLLLLLLTSKIKTCISFRIRFVSVLMSIIYPLQSGPRWQLAELAIIRRGRREGFTLLCSALLFGTQDDRMRCAAPSDLASHPPPPTNATHVPPIRDIVAKQSRAKSEPAQPYTLVSSPLRSSPTPCPYHHQHHRLPNSSN